jgi:hypothetical protein
MQTVKFKQNALLDCYQEGEGDYQEQVLAGEEYEFDKIELTCEDEEENGNIMTLHFEDQTMLANSLWFDVIS